MVPVTLNTILNSAPMIIQGASKLIKLIRDREDTANDDQNTNPTTLEDLKQEISKIDSRLNLNSQSDVEQIKLIEELAMQKKHWPMHLDKPFVRLQH
jgi:hypothetical protein